MPGTSRPPAPVAPWVGTRLRSAPGAALALALLVAVTAFLAAALPRAVDRYGDAGLRRAVESASADRVTLWVTAPQPDFSASPAEREAALRGDALDTHRARILDLTRRHLPVDAEQSAHGVKTGDEAEMSEPWLPRPDGLPARLSLAAQSGLDSHSRLREGRLPRASGRVTAGTASVEGAVTADTARALRIEVGSVLSFPGLERPPLKVRITGIVEPRDPEGGYWSADPLLRTPVLTVLSGDPEMRQYWKGTVLLPPDAAPALLGTPLEPWRYWGLAPSLGGLHAHEVGRLRTAVASLESGPAQQRVREATAPEVATSTELDEVLAEYARMRAAIGPMVAVAAFGTGTVAAVVLLMAGGLAAGRRHAELTLLRARGGSLRGIAGRLLAETAVIALPAAGAGLAAAWLLLPGARPGHSLAAAAAVAALACLALPLRAAAAHRTVRVHTGRQDATTARPSRRRTVAELTLLALAVGAVVALRTRGTSGGPDAAGDQLVSPAPVLVAVIASFVLVRLYPLPLRGLARPARQLRGVVGPLSLARAARASGSAVLPLLALLTALTTAAFGGSVLSGVAEARERAAVLAVGADARVESLHALPAAMPDRIRRVPGVEQVTAAAISYNARPLDGERSVPVAGVDPAGYAALARHTGVGPFDHRALRTAGTPDEQTPVPALASPDVAERYGTRPFPVRMEDGSDVTVRITQVRDRTPAVAGAAFLVVDRSALSARAARTTALLATGSPDPAALRKAAGSGPTVRTRAEERAGYVDSPLQSGAERVYTAAVAAGAGYAVLALLLTLVRAAPERAALLGRLRTMGLTRAQGRRLLVLESLPQALLAALGGMLTAWATIRLLAPGIDLTAVAVPSSVSPPGGATLPVDPLSLLVPALAVLALTVGISVVQAWWTSRRGSVRELRAGDAR